MKLFLCEVAHKSGYDYYMRNAEEKEDVYSGKKFLWPKMMIDVINCTIRSSIFSPLSVEVQVGYNISRNYGYTGFYRINNHADSDYSCYSIPYYAVYGLGMFDDDQLKGFGIRNKSKKKEFNIVKERTKKESIFTDSRKLSFLTKKENKIANRYDIIEYKGQKSWEKRKEQINDFKKKLESYRDNINPIDENSANIIVNGKERNPELPYCVLSNRPNQFIPLVVVKTRLFPETELMTITLVEKRALALSLCHKFECLSPEKGNGLLSIPQIIERLSVVPEDEDEVLIDTSLKNIINFSGVPVDPKEQRGHCAFLSRFIAPSSQSRLSTIYSLARKYGYGLVYRPRSHQYYAIDLLGSTAPGRPTGRRTSCDFPDCYTFDDEDDEYYYGFYSLVKQIRLNQARQGATSPEIKPVDTSFEGFFLHHLLEKSAFFGIDEVKSRESASQIYKYSSRCTTLASTANYPPGEPMSKSGFNLTALLPVLQSDLNGIKEINNSDQKNIYSLFSQSNRWAYKEGAENSSFEDQVGLGFGLDNDSEAQAVICNAFDSVNQRLAFAKYLLKNMKNNKINYGFSFYDKYTKPNRTSNLVYEILNRLGYATSIFANAALNTEPSVVSRGDGRTSPSGATCSIIENTSSERGDDLAMQKFLNNSKGGYNHNPFDKFGKLFGNVDIAIKDIDAQPNPYTHKPNNQYQYAQTEYVGSSSDSYREDPSTLPENRIVGQRYSVEPNMYFYTDIDHQLFKNKQDNQEASQKDNLQPTPDSSQGKDADEPERPQMPATPAPKATNVHKTDSAIEFDYNSEHYSYDNKTMEYLCDRIKRDSADFLPNDQDRAEKYIKLATESQDPLLLIRTYIAYRRFAVFQQVVSTMESAVKKIKGREKDLPYAKNLCDTLMHPERFDRFYLARLGEMSFALQDLEKLSKTPVGKCAGFVECSNGMWRKMTKIEMMEEIDDELYSSFNSLQEPEKISDEVVNHLLKKLRSPEYTYKVDPYTDYWEEELK